MGAQPKPVRMNPTIGRNLWKGIKAKAMPRQMRACPRRIIAFSFHFKERGPAMKRPTVIPM